MPHRFREKGRTAPGPSTDRARRRAAPCGRSPAARDSECSKGPAPCRKRASATGVLPTVGRHLTDRTATVGANGFPTKGMPSCASFRSRTPANWTHLTGRCGFESAPFEQGTVRGARLRPSVVGCRPVPWSSARCAPAYGTAPSAGCPVQAPCGQELVSILRRTAPAEEVGDLARHVEHDRQLRGQGVRGNGCVFGQQVGEGGSDGAAADVVVAGEGGAGAAFQVRGAHGVSLVGRDGGAASALVALGLGGAQAVVGQLALEVALEFAGGGEGLHHELHGGQQLAGARGGRAVRSIAENAPSWMRRARRSRCRTSTEVVCALS
ncbi:hypothetical protein GKJPGBOP_00449 [Streptomyces paromomycinus]|uniref:Uncharacterized protein n=1 Tax=Streptomyces paromomycinus TaxID=92743 RepID=A0A401VUR3_STREY|nr:hypothetical protein GKJPGBOP_00449 [Streptomyces paromomycinus]